MLQKSFTYQIKGQMTRNMMVAYIFVHDNDKYNLEVDD